MAKPRVWCRVRFEGNTTSMASIVSYVCQEGMDGSALTQLFGVSRPLAQHRRRHFNKSGGRDTSNYLRKRQCQARVGDVSVGECEVVIEMAEVEDHPP